jgi:hypothetical protein
MTGQRGVRRWPLVLIASPAAVAIWSGWVALGGLCGFGLVQPFPGIVSWHLDTAITLPIGVEAYGAYALGAWLTPDTPERARTFARRSAVGALALGMTGQVLYHLLAAAHATRAPWPVVVVVSCMPVITLGFGAALTHLLCVPAEESTSGAQMQPLLETVPAAPAAAAEVHPGGASESRRRTQSRTGRSRNRNAVTDADAEMHFAADLAAGQVPSVRRIQRELHVGQPRAKAVHEQMQAVVSRRREPVP